MILEVSFFNMENIIEVLGYPWCLQRLLVPAAVAATCQHTPHLGTAEPRAWGKEKNVSPNQLLFIPQESSPPV